MESQRWAFSRPGKPVSRKGKAELLSHMVGLAERKQVPSDKAIETRVLEKLPSTVLPAHKMFISLDFQ